MKVLFIGGIKSGKSKAAERYVKTHFSKGAKPIYLATTEFIDKQMQERIDAHKKMREDRFITQEEALHLYDTIAIAQGAVLVECLSMWVNNMLYHEYNTQDIIDETQKMMGSSQDIVFVINDVSCGIIPDNKLARKFVDVNGQVAQIVASRSDEVYHVVAGIEVKIK
jgi:adenosylcobinamide kinase/adenosylcobinamide-phosphate guanylyltransferase